MALPDNLKLSKAGMIMFFSWIILSFLLLGCKKAVEDSYGKTYGINIAQVGQKNISSPTDLHDHSAAEIARALEGMGEGNTVVFIMRINKDNLTVRSVIAKTTRFNERPITADAYFYQLMDASETGLFVGGIRGLEYAYNPRLDGKQVIPDPAGVAKIVSSDTSFIIESPYYKNATVLRVIRVEKEHFNIVGDVLLK